eukprot:gnl/Spiro4/20949_TR10206_c0_g1_i1.p1 gnl/Spiro4/20949_TR10206_c0_g1~~gnl/Spiro4/20949_TR10206_c0_g1_i1.p1  ORF type:complete len:190 (+),score=29.51 gnl/Spiro4/20949_TR10206_c0_g1_i1:37-606(+)
MALIPAVTCVNHIKGYAAWQALFDADSPARASLGLCDESRTLKARASDNLAICVLFDVDLPKLLAFLSDPSFAARTADVMDGRPEVYLGHLPGGAPSQERCPAMTAINSPLLKSYSEWAAVFDALSPRRAQCCAESRTIKAQVSETVALVVAFDVDLPKLREYTTSPEFLAATAGLLPGPATFYLGRPM